MIEQNSAAPATNSHTADPVRQQEFGVKLREAREAAGLSVVDVSEALKLKEDLILALENSQIEKLPVSAFTQGYIRSYCRLLKLQADEVIALYNNMTPKQEIPLMQTADVSVQRTSGDGGVKIVTILLVVVGFALVLLWWLQNDMENPVMDQPVISETRDDQVRDDQVNESEMVESVVESQVAEHSVIEEASVEIPDIKTEEKILPSELKTNDVEKTPSLKKPDAAIRQILPGDDILLVRSNADSWTEIEDANGQRLLFQLVRAGDYHQLQGRAPFRIFLGNAPAVEIIINDQPIDLSTHIRQNNIAHVSVKANATARTVRGMIQEKPDNTNISNEQPAE